MARGNDHPERDGPAEDEAPAPRVALPLSVLLVVVMVASMAFVWEPWPFTSFRLFSTNRVAAQGSWETTARLADGSRHPVRIEGLPSGFRGFSFTLNELATLEPEKQRELCEAWISGVKRELGQDVRALVIFRRSWDLSKGETRERNFSQQRRWICTHGAAIPFSDEGGERWSH